MKTTIIKILAAAVLLSNTTHAALTIVPGTSDPWLAGMPNGSTASGGDVAPGQSPVLVTGVIITPGVGYQFSATGTTANDPSEPSSGPDGNPGLVTPHLAGVENGIANILTPVNSLIGVFLGVNAPNLGVAPGSLDFSSPASRNYLTLSPALQQPFFIGDGQTSTAISQSIIAPAGATRLFLGTMDGNGWFNNPGGFSVNVVPEPSAAVLMSIGLLGAWLLRRKQSITQPRS